MKTKHTATLFAILAAALYAINVPLPKLLLTQVWGCSSTAASQEAGGRKKNDH